MITQAPASNTSNLTNLQQSPNTQNTSNKPQANFSATNSLSDSSRNGFLLNNLLNILEQLIRSMGDHQPQLATSNPSPGNNQSSSGSPVQNNLSSNNGNAQDNVTGNTNNTQNNVNTNSPVLLNPTFDVNGGINSADTGSGQPNNLGTSQGATPAQSNNLVSMFSGRDQNLLLGALGIAPGSGATISRIDDVNGSGTLNSGDNIVLQTPGGLQNHTVTDAEVRSFINQRNPIGTPKLSLNNQQSALLQNLHGFTSAQVADLDGDGQLSVGDLITGNTRQGTTTQRLDIPVDAELLAQLGNSGAQQQGDNVQSDNFILGTNNPGGGNGLAGNNSQGQ